MKNVLFFLLLTLTLFLSSCNSKNKQVCSDTEKRNGYTLKTFYNQEGLIEASILTSDLGSIVVVPSTPEARVRKMSEEERRCLEACKKPDNSYDTNCILLCPLTKQNKVYFSYAEAVNVIN